MSFEKFSEAPKFFYIGEYLAIEQTNKVVLYRVKNMDALNYIITGTLSPGQSYINEDTLLQPPQGYMYAFLIGVQGPVKFYLNQPPAVSKWGISSYPGFIDNMISPMEDPDPRTITYTLNGYPVSYRITNPLPSFTVFYAVKFQGFKYRIEEVAQLEPTFQVLTNKVSTNVIQEMRIRYESGSLPVISLIGLTTNR